MIPEVAKIKSNRKGGKQKGAGRPKGKKDGSTMLRDAAIKKFKEKVAKVADTLLMAQAQEAIGTRQIIRKDEIYNKKGKMVSIKWEVVTTKKEIEKVLNNFQDIDGEGEVDGKYYMIVQDKPNYRASDALLNRAFGRPTEHVELATKDGLPFVIKLDA